MKCIGFYTYIIAAVIAAHADPVHLLFKDSVMVNDTVVKLSDIAVIENASSAELSTLNETVVGDAAPAGYSRFINHNDLLTYTLQPSFRNLTFAVTGPLRTQVTTDFVEKKILSAKSDLEQFFAHELTWPQGSWVLSIINENESFKIIDKPYKIQFSGLISKTPRGRFNIIMNVVQGSKSIRVSVNCDLKVTMPVVVAKSVIERGQLIDRNACELRSTDISHLSIVPYDSFDKVVGKKALRYIAEGILINKLWVAEIPDIEKGDPVTIVANKRTVRVAVNAIAREQGQTGDKIWVENSESHKLVRVMVKSKGVVINL